jgi:hypothetical protein
LGWRTFSVSPERGNLGPYEFDGEHYWEIGYAGTRFADVRKVIASAGLTVRRWYRNPDLPWHCVFILEPGGA